MRHSMPPLLLSCVSAAVVLGQEAPPASADAPEATDARPTAELATPALDSIYEARELAGFPLMVSREFATNDPELLARVLLHLEADLDEVAHLVPGPALAALRRTTVWVERQGASNEGMSGRGMCCHWSAEWLASNGLPREKAGGVEIVNPGDFLDWRRNQPYMTLHELAHAYHRMLGVETPEIVRAYRAAMDAGLYDAIDRNTVPLGESVKAYAATNPQEYFAEVSEAYLALNDFAPYTRAQLASLDPAGLAMAETLWSLTAEQIAARIAQTGLVERP